MSDTDLDVTLLDTHAAIALLIIGAIAWIVTAVMIYIERLRRIRREHETVMRALEEIRQWHR